MARQEYIERLQMVIHHLHGCDSKYIRSVPVKETFHGEPIWEGEVEVFSVNHPKANTVYAWATSETRFTAVLGIAPATTAANAVKTAIVADAAQQRK